VCKKPHSISANEADWHKRKNWRARLMAYKEFHGQAFRIGDVNKDIGEFSEEVFVDCFENSKEMLGPNHPRTLAVMSELGTFYFKQGKFELAAPIFIEILEKCKMVHEIDDPHTRTAMLNLAEVYKAQGEYAKADMLAHNFQKDVDSAEAMHLEELQSCSARGDNSFNIFAVMFALADCYYFQHKFAPAYVTYCSILELMKGMTRTSSEPRDSEDDSIDDFMLAARALAENNINSCREHMAAGSTST
jgi:tetratricopeptide (TPR) repeat protein